MTNHTDLSAISHTLSLYLTCPLNAITHDSSIRCTVALFNTTLLSHLIPEEIFSTLKECNGSICSLTDFLLEQASSLPLERLLIVILFALLGVTQMFLDRLDFLVLFASPEGLIFTPNGFTFSPQPPQPIEQRWIQGKCKAKCGDPFDYGENRLIQVQDYSIIFLHCFRRNLMQS